jgi:hypothetical protein
VPAELASCHSAEIAGDIIEGHVPARAINGLIAEKPDALWYRACRSVRLAWKAALLKFTT